MHPSCYPAQLLPEAVGYYMYLSTDDLGDAWARTSFFPRIQESGVSHGATYWTLQLPGVLESSDYFHLAIEAGAFLHAIDSRML